MKNSVAIGHKPLIQLAYRLLIGLIVFGSFSCNSIRNRKSMKKEALELPPGTKKIAENLYLDKEPIRILDYKEYLSDIKMRYGKQSAEYISMIPGYDISPNADTNIVKLNRALFNSAEYNEFTVLGINLQQAKAFGKWRSDWVMAFKLIREKQFSYDKAIDKATPPFSTSSYLAGTYPLAKPKPGIIYYPEYSLIDTIADTRLGFRFLCRYKKAVIN